MEFTPSIARLNRVLGTVLVMLIVAGVGAELMRARARSARTAGSPSTTAMSLSGRVVGVDASAKAIVVEEPIGDGGLTRQMTLVVPDRATIRNHGQPASVSDIRIGDAVRVRYSAMGGKPVVAELSAGELEPAENSGEEKGYDNSDHTPLLVKWFSLSEEKNFPTWWSTFLLLACSCTLAVIARVKLRTGGAYKAHWIVLSAIFCYMSLDEFIEIHEYLNDLGPLEGKHGILYFSWVIPALAVVLVFAVAYLLFLWHLPMETRIKVALAGIIYVGGALGVELILGKWTDVHGEDNLGYALIDLVEETMEMLGSSLFLSTLLEYLGTLVPDLRVRIQYAGK